MSIVAVLLTSVVIYASDNATCKINTVPGGYVYAELTSVNPLDNDGQKWNISVNAYGMEEGRVTVVASYECSNGETGSKEVVIAIYNGHGDGCARFPRIGGRVIKKDIQVYNPICK